MLFSEENGYRFVRTISIANYNMLRMPQDSPDLTAIKTEDYTPGYLSTNAGFNPQAASFFYESGANPAETATASTSAQYALAKVEGTDGSYNANLVRQVPTIVHPQSQHVQTRGYVLAQPQYQQQSQRHHYYPQSAALAQQQREYLVRRDGTVPAHFNVPVIQHGIQYYTQPSGHEQTGVTTHPRNIPYPMVQPVVQQQRLQRNAAGTQHVPILIRSRVPAGVQPQFQYGATQTGVKPELQYSGGEVYMCYDGDINIPSYNQYHAEVSSLGTNSFHVNQQNGLSVQVPVHQAQLGYAQVPLEYAVDTPHNNKVLNGQDAIVKAEAMDEQTAVDGGLIKRRRRSRKSKTDEVTLEGEEAGGATVRKRRTSKRKKLINDIEGAEASLAETNVVNGDSPPTLTHGELLKQKKKNMAFPKGTFLVRYADLDCDNYAGHIWLVDNHQLLQKYTYDGLDASNLKIFSRTERYSGWLCMCPWLYHPLPDVVGILGNMEKVAVRNHPTRDELFARRDEESRKAPIIEEEHVDTAEEAVNSDVEHMCNEHGDMTLKEELPDDSPLCKKEEPDIM
uniref:JmjC domain-containing protein n=2 Tax=Haemonchus contortus TaxID=6289 RepID=A0A7I4XZ32_HAECO